MDGLRHPDDETTFRHLCDRVDCEDLVERVEPASDVWSIRVAAGELAVSIYLTTTAFGIFVGYAEGSRRIIS